MEDIWAYIARNNENAADRFIDQLYEKCLQISSLEEIGKRRDELSHELLSVAHKKYVIFFFRTKSRIEIARILHGNRDIPAQFKG